MGKKDAKGRAPSPRSRDPLAPRSGLTAIRAAAGSRLNECWVRRPWSQRVSRAPRPLTLPTGRAGAPLRLERSSLSSGSGSQVPPVKLGLGTPRDPRKGIIYKGTKTGQVLGQQEGPGGWEGKGQGHLGMLILASPGGAGTPGSGPRGLPLRQGSPGPTAGHEVDRQALARPQMGEMWIWALDSSGSRHCSPSPPQGGLRLSLARCAPPVTLSPPPPGPLLPEHSMGG